MPALEEQLRNYHLRNYNEVNSALRQVERAAKMAVKKNDKSGERFLTKTQLLLVAVKSEARLHRILYLDHGLIASERNSILSERTVYDSWLKLIDIAFRKHFSISLTEEIGSRLRHSDLSRYNTLLKFFEEELQFLIHVRNKLAHGQWQYPLNGAMTEVDATLIARIKAENCRTLLLRDHAFDAIGNIVSDLIQSRALFQSRFDAHYARVQRAERSLAKQDHAAWSQRLRASHQAGLQKLRNSSETGSLATPPTESVLFPEQCAGHAESQEFRRTRRVSGTVLRVPSPD